MPFVSKLGVEQARARRPTISRLSAPRNQRLGAPPPPPPAASEVEPDELLEDEDEDELEDELPDEELELLEEELELLDDDPIARVVTTPAGVTMRTAALPVSAT